MNISCLALDSTRWSSLSHAYGKATDIPPLIERLQSVPSYLEDDDTWERFWSALAHQGDVYSASFAAVPHVIRLLASAPLKADSTYFQFPAVVEIWRQDKNVAVPTA